MWWGTSSRSFGCSNDFGLSNIFGSCLMISGLGGWWQLAMSVRGQLPPPKLGRINKLAGNHQGQYFQPSYVWHAPCHASVARPRAAVGRPLVRVDRLPGRRQRATIKLHCCVDSFSKFRGLRSSVYTLRTKHTVCVRIFLINSIKPQGVRPFSHGNSSAYIYIY